MQGAHGLRTSLKVKLIVLVQRGNFLVATRFGFGPPSHRANFALITPAIMKKLIALLALAGVANLAAAADVVGNPKAAENKVSMCIGCHGIPGYKATFPEVYQVPMIGGQSAKYIENALKAYQKGERKHPSMRGIAAGLSDQDIADVAAYYATQK
jgi:cytochrome c553